MTNSTTEQPTTSHLAQLWTVGGQSFHEVVAGVNNADGHLLRKNALYPVILRLLRDVNGLQILDAGCGDGELCQILASSGAKVVGVDFSQSLLTTARESFPHIHFGNANIGELPFPTESMHSILNNLTLMWMNDTDLNSFAQESLRVLKPGGTLVTSFMHPYTNIIGTSTDVDGHSIKVIDKSYRSHTRVRRINGTSACFTYFHRPVSEYLNTFARVGLIFNEMDESFLPLDANIGARTEERQHLPEFSVLQFTKPLL